VQMAFLHAKFCILLDRNPLLARCP
jgi:hypothetical protein